MEKYFTVACLQTPMWLLLPFMCVLGATESDFTGNNTPMNADLLADRSGDGNRFVGDLSWVVPESEVVYSKPIIDEIPVNDLRYPNLRRDVPERGFTEDMKLEILDLHNVYRGNVTPPAGDMAFMEWDSQLEHLAQLWADGCLFEHGKPPNTSYPGLYGQNLYIGTDPTGYRGLWLWYDEHNYYNLTTQLCEPDDPDQTCGHYVTMSWAPAFRLGCGIRKCGLRYLIVCHYFPAALRGQQIYTVAKPCSQCPDEGGSLCLNKLCLTWDQCERNPKLCKTAKCNLKCHNCGRLDKAICKCQCADGYDSPDCSRLCTDEHERCGVSPGFPTKLSCSMNKHAVAKKYCRKMCGSCNAYEEGSKISHICCGGKFCDDGYVFDMERKPCRCTILCPGPLCDTLEGAGASLRNNFVIAILTLAVVYFNMHSYSHC